MRDKIKPNDVVFHKPTGETLVVCGVNYEQGKLVPCGYPFPSIVNIDDCEILEWNYEKQYQTKEQIKALMDECMNSYIDVPSAEFLNII